jgi:hypothetical protein
VIDSLLAIHLVCAAGATAIFWIAAFASKRGTRHPQAGRWFARAIYAAAATGGLLAAAGFLRPELMTSASRGAADTRHLMAFILYLLIVIVTPVQHGVAVVVAGARPARVRSRAHATLNMLALLGAVALFPAALIWHAWFFLLAVPAGFLLALRNMQYAGRGSATATAWQREHLTSLISAGVALHTGFFVLTALRMGHSIPVMWRWTPWLVPAAIGLPVIFWLRRSWFAEPRG